MLLNGARYDCGNGTYSINAFEVFVRFFCSFMRNRANVALGSRPGQP